ncbi:extracellular solute-binding protein [Sinimarinibacterium flocculans]|uniref:Iron(III) transport system substrate-binding protein n=1 Tax=Sinimarinibacterium flocculans TaxID=985250 RepID=A0A318EKZ1_9GAMM|nr:extracellular solute-binding protein [Sinimarinibacterium flocculans]PXV71514.1 iron(III) transport system substrate-binding protein [Sinimarinibacterium flocculans]
MMTLRQFLTFAGTAATFLFAASPAHAETVNLYTTREPGLIQPLLSAFTRETGVDVRTIFIKDGLAERVAAEGERSPADVLMTVDFGNLIDLVDHDLVQAVDSEVLRAAVPAALRDAGNRWFALSMRARLVYAAKDLDLEGLTYEDLADPRWKGRFCMRSGLHPYSTALIAAYIAHHGEAAAEAWLQALKANLARKAGGGDREVARDILGQLCDIGVGNSYYVGRMRSGAGGPEQQKWGDAIQVVLPRFENGGTHVNISGAAVARHAPNRDQAVRLLEYLVSPAAQQIYAHVDFEYPVNEAAEPDPITAAYGTLQPDALPLTEIARHRRTASLMAERIGFDN